MPKTRFQNIVFTAVMAFVMVYAIICYNISLNIGGMTNQVFIMAFGELKIMWPVAFVLELLVVDKLAHMLAMRIVTPGVDKPIFIILAISIFENPINIIFLLAIYSIKLSSETNIISLVLISLSI